MSGRAVPCRWSWSLLGQSFHLAPAFPWECLVVQNKHARFTYSASLGSLDVYTLETPQSAMSQCALDNKVSLSQHTSAR